MSIDFRIMKSNFSYGWKSIGGGISRYVFASYYSQNNIKKRIALIEVGRVLGGRLNTRTRKRFKELKLNHGALNYNISKSKDNILLKIILMNY